MNFAIGGNMYAQNNLGSFFHFLKSQKSNIYHDKIIDLFPIFQWWEKPLYGVKFPYHKNNRSRNH